MDFFLLFVFVFFILPYLCLAHLWSPAEKRADLLAVLYVMFSSVCFCHFPMLCP